MKRGFTLIELLAVIVILAVLALIATPIVLNIIDDSKKNATLRSSENYIKAIEFSIAKSVMENKRLSDGTYQVMQNGSICLGTLTGNTCSDTLVVEVSGETPESGTVTIKSRKIDSYEFTYKSGFVVANGEIQEGDVIVQLEPGLYDENNNLIYSWEELTTTTYTLFLEGEEVQVPLLIVEEASIVPYMYQEIPYVATDYLVGKLVIADSVTDIGSYAFYGCTGLTSITIPDSVTSIGSSAFSGCTGLTSITIPDSVTNMGREAFYGCTGLTSVTMPNSVTDIRESAFSGCTGLTSVTIPNSVTDIGETAFSGCTGLTSITLGTGIEIIRSAAFDGCSSLKIINYRGTEEEWNLIAKLDYDLLENITKIYNYKGE